MPPRTRTSRAGRLAQLGGVATGAAVKRLGTRTANSFRDDQRAAAAIEARNLEMAERLVTVLGTMKGGAQKFGQMLSMVDAGLIPASHRDEFQAKLAALHDNAPKVPWTKMRGLIEAELGKPLDEAFASFDQDPVAAASIGQVYRATLPDGREVAVKVQYPGIDTAVRADLKNLTMFMKVSARFFHEGLDAKQLAAELEERITEELDYELEARNTRLVARAYRGHPFIVIPDTVPAYCTQRVLTTEWIEGRPLSSTYDAPLQVRNHVAEIVYRFYAATPFLIRMYSGDPHPGNCLVLDDGRVAFLDFGLFKQISPEVAAAELETVRATIERDADRLMAVLRGRGFIPDSAPTEPEELLESMWFAGAWQVEDAEVEVSTALTSRVAAEFADPRTKIGAMALQHNLPADHAFRARAEGLLFAVLGQLRPTMNFHRVLREWAYGDAPATDLGRRHATWMQEVGHAVPAR